MQPTSFLFLATLVASASAHGWIGTVKVASSNKVFKGNKPTEETPKGSASAIRQISNNSPVKDLSSSDLTCGRDALKASEVITVPAGSQLDITWQTATENGLWFHDVGPMLTYMAECDGSCADFDASKAKFFKIQEQAKDSSGKWYQERLDNGSPASVTIPSNLKAGNYLLRHEIIALHTAMTKGNAEFYPGCVQLTVTGSGSGAPSSGETVSLPGAYKSTDAGILIDVYNMKGDYQFPGPKVASFVGGSSNSAPANGGDNEAGDDEETKTTKKASSPAKTSSSKDTKATSIPVKDASPTTTAQSPAPTSGTGSSSGSKSPSCKAKRDRRGKRAVLVAAREAEPVIDVTKKLRRSRVHNLHRAGGVARSF